MKFQHFIVSLCFCLATILTTESAQGITFTNSSGNIESINFNMRPDAKFDYTPKSGPAPLWVTFQNRSLYENDIQWVWQIVPCVDYGYFSVDFDKAMTLSSQVIPYTHPGTYFVYLQAENDVGTDVELKFVEVTEPMPFGIDFTHFFTVDSSSGDGESSGKEVVSFTPFVAYSDFMTFTYLWNFGDGSGSSAPNPTHEYQAGGTYIATLSVSDCTGWYSATVSKIVNVVKPTTPPPTADFVGSPLTGPEGTTVNFVNTTQGTYGNSLWDFGDATSATTTGKDISHKYDEAGTYTVTLTVFSDSGSFSKTRSNYITIGTGGIPQVIVDFYGAPRSVLVGSTVYFYNNTSAEYDQSLWSFGDGTGSNEDNPEHKYTESGVYSVSLQVIGSFGAIERTRNGYISVQAVGSSDAAEPLFIADPVTGQSPHMVQFNNLNGGDMTDVWWDFGDGTTSTDLNPIHTFEQPGTYTVTLFAGDNAKTRLDYICTLPETGDYQTPAVLLMNGNQEQLAALGTFRDTIMDRSVYGSGLMALYYKHALELTAIIQDDPALFAEVQYLVASRLPEIESSLTTGVFGIAPEIQPAIITVLGKIADKAGPELSAAIIKLMKDIDNDQFFQSINRNATVN